MRIPTFSAAVLARLLVLGGALILVGSLVNWVVFSVQPLFGWTYPSGLDLGFGIVTALAGIGILTVGARLRVERPRSAWTAVGLALVTLALVALALVVAMNHDPSDGRMFDGIGPGAIVVALGAMTAALAGWWFAIRSSAAREPGSSPRRPRWQGAALLAGGLLLWTEGFLFVVLLLWHAATGRSSQGPDFLGVRLDAWNSYFSVSGHQVGWDVAYVAFLPIGVASLLGSLVLLRGLERPALAVAAVWFIEAFVFSLGSLRLSGFFWTQLIVLALFIAGARPRASEFVRWVVGRPAEPHSNRA